MRIVSATNLDLEDSVKSGAFRSDLFYRMNAVTIRIPPLRERDGDPVLLANYFLGRFNKEFGRNLRGFTQAALLAVAAHGWPGNVRELENRMKRAVVMSEGRLIDASDLELAAVAEVEVNIDLRIARLRAERDVVQMALARSNGVLAVAAKMLGISRPTLYGLMEAHAIAPDPSRSEEAALPEGSTLRRPSDAEIADSPPHSD